MIKWKDLIICVAIPLFLGFLSSLFGTSFNDIYKPSFTPPEIIFPIVWTILYVLMGISSYLIYESGDEQKNNALKVYFIQLIINCLWTLFFFNLKWFLFSTFLIIVILILTIVMVLKFYKINKMSAYLQIPYIIWLLFALILSYNVYLLN